MDPVTASVEDLTGAYAAGTAAPVEVTATLLDRIEALDGALSAFCLIDREASLAMARAAEARWRAGRPLSVLDGVPVAVKDILLTRGWPTLRGSATVGADGPETDDAPCVARLREAGAVLIGKTTTPEIGWKAVTDNPATGLITRNPWDPALTPGGSSGGASAALAAGFCPLAIGTDGGGSIRIPASFTGTVGLKPSFGRVPAWPLSPFGTVAHIGPMARSTRDAALFLSVLARPDPRDWYALPQGAADWTLGLEDGIRGWRVAYAPRLGCAEVDERVADLVARAARTMAALGAEVEEIDPPLGDTREMFRTLWWTGAATALGDLPDETRARLDPGLSEVIAEGQAIDRRTYVAAVKAREALGSAMRGFMTGYDLILTPTVAVLPFEAGRNAPPDGPDAWRTDHWLGWTPFSYPFNLTQQPAISVPCGFTEDGRPVGLQIVGPMHRDDMVLRAGRAFETANTAYRMMPDTGAFGGILGQSTTGPLPRPATQ